MIATTQNLVCKDCGAYVPKGWSHTCSAEKTMTWETSRPTNRSERLVTK